MISRLCTLPICALVALSSLLGLSASAAEEPPKSPNLAVISITGLDGVGAPAWGLDEVLPDPEIRARVTPNLERLAEMGVRFENAFFSGVNELRQKDDLIKQLRLAGYRGGLTQTPAEEEAPHREEMVVWNPGGGDRLVRVWAKWTPTSGTGRKREDDLSIAAWERLVESHSWQREASHLAEQIAGGKSDKAPALHSWQLETGEAPFVARCLPGVFFDRFPLDQIAIPKDDYDRKTLARRMGYRGGDVVELATDAKASGAWKKAIQAWLANASSIDYAIGKIVDEVEAVNSDDGAANDWTIVLVAFPSDITPKQGQISPAVDEIQSRAELLILAPNIAKPGQQVVTPVSLRDVTRTLGELAGIGSGVSIEDQLTKPLHNPPTRLEGESLLPLLERAGERYDQVAITASGDSFGIRSNRFRLLHRDGMPQQLYDLSKDLSGFVDLLDPDNETSLAKFGLSPTQVESVRQWLAWKLTERLKQPGQVGTKQNAEAAIASLEKAGIFQPPADYKSVMPGDFNRDGVVNAADKTIWRDHLEDEVAYPGADADANHDGRVDQQDEAIWRANYGRRAR